MSMLPRQRTPPPLSSKKAHSIGVGMVGAGFLAETRARCYAQVSGVDARIVAVTSRSADSAQKYAERFSVPTVCLVVMRMFN